MQHHETKPEDKVPVRTKLGYGAGMASERLQVGSFNQMINPIFNDILGIDARIIGICMGCSRVFDAITDPIIGHLSDNTRSRFGRRRPWLAVSAFLCAIAFAAIWMFPSGMSQNFYVMWVIVTAIIFFMCLSLFSVPYSALGMELTPDYHERTSVMAYKSTLAKMGGFMTSSLYMVTSLDCFDNMAVGMRYTSMGMGVMIILFSLCPAFFAKEHPSLIKRQHAEGSKKVGLIESAKHTLKNGPFLLMISVTVTMLFGLTMVNFLSYYITIYYMFEGHSSVSSGLVLTACGYGAQIGGLLGIPTMAYTAKRIGKRKTLLYALALAFTADLLKWFCFTPENPYLSVIPGVISAFALISVWTLMQAMLPDVVDLDELRTHQRREGMFSAIQSWTIKLGMSLALMISGFILSGSGFDPSLGADQHYGTITKIRVYYSLIPALAMIGGFILMYFYPLTEERSYLIRAKLDRRQRALEAQKS